MPLLCRPFWVGLVNLVFTILAIAFVDKLGRKPLLIFGVTGIALCMFLLSYGFSQASYTLTETSVVSLPAEIKQDQLAALVGVPFDSDLSYKKALTSALGEDIVKTYESQLITAAANMNAMLILISILGFVASFAISIGPVMWVLFSELFPNRIRGLAISFVGLINSAISFLVQLVFPWELSTLGSSTTFLIYGVFCSTRPGFYPLSGAGNQGEIFGRTGSHSGKIELFCWGSLVGKLVHFQPHDPDILSGLKKYSLSYTTEKRHSAGRKGGICTRNNPSRTTLIKKEREKGHLLLSPTLISAYCVNCITITFWLEPNKTQSHYTTSTSFAIRPLAFFSILNLT